MIKNDCSEIVKKEFDFGWKAGHSIYEADLLALEYQKGDILDVGCGTCRLYNFLIQRGWTGQYIGIDAQRYDDYAYPPGIELITNDATAVTFPKIDTVVLSLVIRARRRSMCFIEQIYRELPRERPFVCSEKK